MAGVVPILPRLKFTDGNGKPLAMGTVTVYLAGTSTLATTWQDEALTTPNTNPVALDANGEALFWIDQNLRYKFLLKDKNGVTAGGWPVDNVPGAGGEGPLDTLTFTQDAPGAVPRSALDKLREVAFSPNDVGGKGDGIADDGDALISAFAWMRTLINASGGTLMISVDGAGKVYRTTKSINGTALVSGWEFKDATIVGECTGKCVLDLIGSRSGRLTNVRVVGSQLHRPSVGIQTARSSVPGFEFCDGLLMDRVFTQGFFSTAPHIFYGQEGSVYRRCQFWNSDKDAYIGVLQGSDIVPMFSDYLAPMTGPTSYINDKYINCDWLFLPVGASANITGISKANPAVVQSAGHPFNNGDAVAIGLVNGMAEINNVVAVVQNKTSSSYELAGVNSTGMSTYAGGGQAVIAQTKPSVLFSRGAQHDFDTCYIVNYGTDSFQVDPADGAQLAEISLGLLCEGQGSRSHVRFTGGVTIMGFSLRIYNTCCRNSLFSAGGAGAVTLFGGPIRWNNAAFGTPTLFDTPARYAVLCADLVIPSTTQADKTTLGANFSGLLKHISTGKTSLINGDIGDYRDGNFTPVVAPSAGAITAYTATGKIRRHGGLPYITISISVTNNGTGSGGLTASLPFVALADGHLIGSNLFTNVGIKGLIAAGSSSVAIAKTSDGSYPVASGQTLSLAGWGMEA